MQPQPRYSSGDLIGGRFKVHEVKMGAMGEVYLGYDLGLEAPYALKTFQARYFRNAQVRDLFSQEIATWVALEKHANIVRCHFIRVFDNQPFMFLEWVTGEEDRGTDLSSWLQHGPLDPRLAMNFTIDICRGLIHANQKQPGIVHRDLKPDNILINQSRMAKITDFGLATVTHAALLTDATTDEMEMGHNLRDKNLVGTPLYMSPEQWRADEVDSRSDIYAVGCILYELLTGNFPYIRL